ncbi:MAG: hypothetical protein QXJ68_02645 [Methanocellales archaeon]
MFEAEANWYTKACKNSTKALKLLFKDLEEFKQKIEIKASKELLRSIDFTGLDLEVHEVLAFAYLLALSTLSLFLIIDFVILYSVGFNIPASTSTLLLISTIAIPLLVLHYASHYPELYAKYLRIHSLGDAPEVLSYIVMNMKLVSNIERSIKFAAENSNRPLARDLRKLMWDMHFRVYSSIDDAITSFASEWGEWSSHFKRAIHLIRSSLGEPDEAQRIITLNRALDVVLEGTKNIMDEFASRLHTPTTVLYSIGVMIPLALVAMLPAASVIGYRINTFELALIYNLLLPVVTFIYADSILLKRPAAFTPPQIPLGHESLPSRKRRCFTAAIAIAVGIVIALPGFLYLALGIPKIKSQLIAWNSNITILSQLNSYFPTTLLVIWGIAIAISIYCIGIYLPYKKIRDRIKKMEGEFSDALYILGKRISEGKSAEEAFAFTSETMEGSEIATIFSVIAYNFAAMRTTVKEALFDEEFGAFKEVYSDRILATMKLFIESVQKSNEAAGIALVKLADHLKELQAVEENIKRALYTMTSMMRTTAMIFAPLIGGVTLALSEVVARLLASIMREMPSLPSESRKFLPMLPRFTEMSIAPEYFVLIIGIYLVMLTCILIRFIAGIEHGDDKAQFMFDLGIAMPIAIFVFSIFTISSRILFGMIVG